MSEVTMSQPAFSQRSAALKARVEGVIREFIDERTTAGGKLEDALRYAAYSEGKRIRPLLSYAAAELLDVPLSVADYPAAAIELVHTYSLVHDDLPAIDDDNLRRGKPTVHCAFDEATAILVGDALYTCAFELLSCAEENAALVVAWVRELAHAAGVSGMIRGQAMDLEGETRRLEFAELENISHLKTGALIGASLTMVANASKDHHARQRLAAFGRHFGLAFQIKDDILDVEASTGTLGKPQGSDAQNNKSTFVSLLGVDGARLCMHKEVAAAIAQLADCGPSADGLRWLAGFIVDRQL